jgi:hypothetical protein
LNKRFFFNSSKDEELKKVDEKEEMETLSSSEEDDETDEEQIEEERRLQKALLEKDKVSLALATTFKKSLKFCKFLITKILKYWNFYQTAFRFCESSLNFQSCKRAHQTAIYET